MATQKQSDYIADLAVLKTKEFKEVKEMLQSSGIVSEQAGIVAGAQSLAEITHALTDLQASRLIEMLIAAKKPERSRIYAQKRVEKAIKTLDEIKATVAGWTF
jgi:hypothetical protein